MAAEFIPPASMDMDVDTDMDTEITLLAEDQFERSCITLLLELEASLQGSRKALLALDLAGIERGTREQVGLMGRFEPFRRWQRAAAANQQGSAPEGHRTFLQATNASELQAELKRCAHRVQEAVRLQAALLARAQAKLRVLGNMLAVPSVTYEPPPRSGARLRVLERTRGREI